MRMKKFLLLFAAVFVAMNLSAESLGLFTTEGNLKVTHGNGWSWDRKNLPNESNNVSAYRKAATNEMGWSDPENVLEGKDMSTYIKKSVGYPYVVGPVDDITDGVAKIYVRSKEAAVNDHPYKGEDWYEYDPSTWKPENVAKYDTQGFIMLPEKIKINADDKIFVSMEVRADKAISGVSGCYDDFTGHYLHWSDIAFDIGTTWTRYEKEILVSYIDDANFGSIAFWLSQIDEENTIYFKNVKVMISHVADYLLMEDLDICKSETNILPISMSNMDEITAFQFDVVVPQDITLTDVQLGTRKTDSHTVEFTKQEDFYRVVGVSLQSAPFSGNEGELVNLVLTADGSIKKGEYSIYIKDIVLTSLSGEKFYPHYISATLTVSESTTGDTDGDGYIDVADIVAMINYIIGKPLTAFIPLAADINGDGEVDVFDVMECINLVLNQNSRMENNARAAEAANDVAEDIITINDFNISAGETKDVSISLDNPTEYVLFQFDLYLPEGITIESYSADPARLPESTTLSMSQQEDGSYRFISYNMKRQPIVGNSGNIITLRVNASNDFTSDVKTGYFRKVKLSKADATGPTYEEMTFPINGATYIKSVKQEKSFDIYDLLGRKVTSTTKGIFIRNGKKVVTK